MVRYLKQIDRETVERLLKRGRMLIAYVKTYGYGYTLIREIHYYMAFGKVKKIKPLEDRTSVYLSLEEAVNEIVSMKPRIRYIKIVA